MMSGLCSSTNWIMSRRPRLRSSMCAITAWNPACWSDSRTSSRTSGFVLKMAMMRDGFSTPSPAKTGKTMGTPRALAQAASVAVAPAQGPRAGGCPGGAAKRVFAAASRELCDRPPGDPAGRGLEPRIAELLQDEFATAPAGRGRTGGDPAADGAPALRAYEAVLTTLDAFASGLLPRLVYHLESIGAHLPECRGVVVAAFAGETLHFVDARALIARDCKM